MTRVQEGELQVHSVWSELASMNESIPDLEKHELITWYCHHLLETMCPWLPPLIRSAGAEIVAGPGHFFLTLPDGAAYLVPELSIQLNLLPWVEPGDRCH